MSAIDLIILGIVMERPQSAYDIQKDVEYHHLSRWTKIGVPTVYKKVLQLKEKGYLQSELVQGEKWAGKAVYSVTAEGRACFERLMTECASQKVPLLFDFNVVIANLNKLEKPRALELVRQLRVRITESAQANDEYASAYPDIPLVGRTIFEQQRLLYRALLDWLDQFESQFREN